MLLSSRGYLNSNLLFRFQVESFFWKTEVCFSYAEIALIISYDWNIKLLVVLWLFLTEFHIRIFLERFYFFIYVLVYCPLSD